SSRTIVYSIDDTVCRRRISCTLSAEPGRPAAFALNAMSDRSHTVIIGGGFAGLGAAGGPARQGIRGTVFEGKPALGGRAYSFPDPDTGDFVDNGQHVMMGCYGETLDFLDQVGAREQLVFQDDLDIEMLAGSGKSAHLRTTRLPGPLH